MPDQDSTTLTELLSQARRGDPQGKEKLFAACRDYLNLAARVQLETWLRSKIDASDIVQQTLLEAHRDFQEFQGQTDAEWMAWLKRILARNAADFVRQYHGTAKRDARKEVPLLRPGDDSACGAWEPAAPGDSPSQLLIRRDYELRVAAALSRLSLDHREVILLRNLQRLPFDEVALRMGRSRPAVQMLWMRAIRKLQELLVE
jgi:RNA polymerase sigma-70 factor (ECF subfamily)